MKTKNLLFAALFLCSTSGLFGQEWIKNITTENPTFYEIKEAFDAYWEPFNVNSKGRFIRNGVEVKAPGWKQFKRWESYWVTRVGPTGQFPENDSYWKVWNKNKNLFASNAKSNPSWSPIGPYDKSVFGLGRINCMAFHPTDPNTYFVGTPAGGMWKTTNDGLNWTPMTDNLPVIGVSSIIVDPSNPNTMYIATGDGDAAAALQTFGAPFVGDTKSIGIFKSTDGGATWNHVLVDEQSNGFLIRRMVMASTGEIYAATNQGILKSSDAGVSWNNIQSGYFMDIELHPTDDQTLYASTFDPAGGNAQVYVTTNSGVLWTQTSSFSDISRINIEVTPASPMLVDLLCVDLNSEGLHSLIYSTDEGQSWTPYYDGTQPGNNLLGYNDDGSDVEGQGTYDLAYAIDPNNANNIILAGINAFRTTDAGSTWVPSNCWTDGAPYNSGSTPVVHADKHYLTYHPLVANTLFECNDGGIYKSSDGGSTWTDLTNGLQISQFYSISNSQTNSNLVVGGRQDNGSLAMESGIDYKLTGGDGMMAEVDYSDEDIVYTSYVRGELYRYDFSISNAETTISDNIIEPHTGAWLTPYKIHPTTPTTIYAAYDEVFQSDDRGDNWIQISNFGFGQPLNYIDVAASNSNYIYVAWYDQIERTTDGGSNWTDITGSLPVSSLSISSIQVSPLDEDVVFVTVSGYSATEKVYFTQDGGQTWENITESGLPNLPVNCVEYDENTDNVYLGTDMGVYAWDGVMNAWVPYGAGLPNVVITDLDIQESSNKLRAGTFGRGLWETDLAQFPVNVTEEVLENSVSISPNPNNGDFNLYIDSYNQVREVMVLNELGQVVYRTNQKTNNYSITNLDKGVYFVKVHYTGNKMFTDKVVVM